MGRKRSYSYSSDSSAYEKCLGEIVKLIKNRKKRRGDARRRHDKKSSHRSSHGSSRHRSPSRTRSPSLSYSDSSSSSVDSRMSRRSRRDTPRHSRSRSHSRSRRNSKSTDPAIADVPDNSNIQSTSKPDVPAIADDHDTAQSTVKSSSGKLATSRAEVLKKLGKVVLEDKKYSTAVNELITRRWTSIVKKGLPEKETAGIVALYPTPENNPVWDPPKLNLEVKSTMQGPAILRDSSITEKQSKLSACLAVTAHMIEEIMKQEPSDFNNRLLEKLGDQGSILADLQHDQSCIRKNLIIASTPSTSTKKILSETEFSEFLFGDKFDDAVKSAKALAATSEELRQSQNKNSSKQPKNSKGPPQPLKYQQKTLSGGQHNSHRSSYNNRRGSPRRSSRKEPPKKDQQRHPRYQRK